MLYLIANLHQKVMVHFHIPFLLVRWHHSLKALHPQIKFFYAKSHVTFLVFLLSRFQRGLSFSLGQISWKIPVSPHKLTLRNSLSASTASQLKRTPFYLDWKWFPWKFLLSRTKHMLLIICNVTSAYDIEFSLSISQSTELSSWRSKTNLLSRIINEFKYSLIGSTSTVHVEFDFWL